MTPKTPDNKFPVFLLSLIIVSFLQLNWKASLGWSPELVMTLMVISGFYLNILEMAALSAVGIFIFNWRPVPGAEILFFFFIPFLIVFARRFFPWRVEINNIAGIILAVSLFYAVFGLQALMANIPLFILILVITAGFGAAGFQLFNYFYKISPI